MATNAGAAPKDSRRRLLIVGGVAVAAALAGALYFFLQGPRAGETEIIVGDGSIRIESRRVPWDDYFYIPGGSNTGEALAWLSKKENGKIETVTAGSTTANCADKVFCVVTLFYRNTANPAKEATVILASGKRGGNGKGLLVSSSIPRKEYSRTSANILESNDTTYKVYSAFVWTVDNQGNEQTTPLCGSAGSCQVTADYK